MIRYWLTGMAVFVSVAGVASERIVGIAYADDAPAFHCEAGAKIDGSQATDARRKMIAAGYREISQLKKGCDSYWHGVGVKDGVSTHLLVAPQGRVEPEGE